MQDLLIVAAAVVGLWILFSSLNRAWKHEQAYKAEQAAWMAAHPEERPSAAGRLVNLTVILAGLAAVGWLTNVAHINVGPACLIVAIPVLMARRVRRARRQQSAENRARFGEYTPTFRQ